MNSSAVSFSSWACDGVPSGPGTSDGAREHAARARPAAMARARRVACFTVDSPDAPVPARNPRRLVVARRTRKWRRGRAVRGQQGACLEPGAGVLGVALEPGPGGTEAEAVAPGVHVGHQPRAADARQLARQHDLQVAGGVLL